MAISGRPIWPEELAVLQAAAAVECYLPVLETWGITEDLVDLGLLVPCRDDGADATHIDSLFYQITDKGRAVLGIAPG